MSGMMPWLLIGIAAGVVLVIADLLVMPVVRGWRTERPMFEWLPGTEPGTLSARVIDNCLALALVACAVFAFRFAGFA